MIFFPCPSCRLSLQVKDDLAGKKAKCPKCGDIVPIPTVEPQTTPPPVLNPKTGDSRPIIFISHSTKDRAFVEREIIQLLHAHGLQVWYSKDDISTATDWERTIKKGLDSCDWFLVAMSPNSVVSENVRDEVLFAMTRKPAGRIVPVLIGACDPLDFHIRMNRIQYVNFVRDPDAKKKLLATWGVNLASDQHAASENAPALGAKQPAAESGGRSLVDLLIENIKYNNEHPEEVEAAEIAKAEREMNYRRAGNPLTVPPLRSDGTEDPVAPSRNSATSRGRAIDPKSLVFAWQSLMVGKPQSLPWPIR